MNRRNRKNLSFLHITQLILSFLSVFIIIGFIIFSSFRFPSSALNSIIENIKVNDLFIHFLGLENHYFYSDTNKNNDFSLTNFVFTLTTNIKVTDIKTLLAREIPGFSIYDTEIAIAGVGTDLTNLPFESSPPLEVLLNEREIAQKKLENSERLIEKSETKEQLAPSRTTNGKKVVYIYHSHSWEAFSPLLKGVKNPNEANSSNEKVNVVGLGTKLMEELTSRGIGAEHDTTDVTKGLLVRNWNYYKSYTYSRERVKEAMSGNKDLNFLIDIHRDSQPRNVTTITINGKLYARLFFVVGKEHKNFEENLILAKEINSKLEEKFPGISRGVFVKGKNQGNGVYNQDLTERALLLEFGGVENDLPELHNSIDAFAEVFSEAYWKDARGI